jgi:hypothetical protein
MNHSDILSLAGLRIDGRKHEEVRNISFRLNVSSICDGSCYYEQVSSLFTMLSLLMLKRKTMLGIEQSLGLCARSYGATATIGQ